MKHDPKDLVGSTRRVRVHSGAIGHEKHVMAEGKVVAYSQHPQILVQADDGTQSWWPVTLPIDVMAPPLPDEPPIGSLVHLAAYYGVYERLERGWMPAKDVAGSPLEWEVLVRLNSGQTPVLLVPVTGAPYLPWLVTSNVGNEITVNPPNEDGEIPMNFAELTTGVLLSPASARGLAAALNAAADKAE